MIKLDITIKNTENVGDLSQSDVMKINEIVTTLITTGSLTGVKAGQTILHFDQWGEFQGVEINYFPWRKKRSG